MLICGGYIPGMSVSAQNTTSSSTQNSRRISGVVTDTQGEPIIGATVLVKGTGIGTATDIDGKFSLDSIQWKNLGSIFHWIRRTGNSCYK